ncbi:hypothetical protein SprV_0200667300 [Sparganum proliferum]
MVDTGAQISVVPPTPVDRRCPSPGLHLQAANCSPISTVGSRSLTLNIGLRRSFSWIFVIADVPHAILGSDFLAEFDLLVDCRRSCLLDRTTGLSVRGLTPFNDSCNLSVLDTVFARPRRLAPSRLQAAKAEFEHMPQLGIIRPSESPWASPQHMVRKATSDDWRSCGDYRALNNAAIPDRYTVPHLQDFPGALFGKSVFAKIDLVRAFHQIPVAPEDVPKTAVTTPFGLFEFIRMPFGLRNAAQTFQRFIDRVLRGLPFVYAYIDDLLVASRNAEEHKEHLALVFDRLDQFGVVINPSKCVLGVLSLDFLGHHVDAQGLRPLSSKVEAIRDFPLPTSKRQLQRFLGMVNFYRRFLPNCADLMLPLTNMLSGPKGPLELTGEALTAFERIKNSLADATLLTHPAPEAQLSLMVDASTVAVGAVLQQHLAGSTQPLAFFSKKLLPAETRYSTFDRELLAIYLAVKHFRHFLEGQEFTIFADHKPLTFAIHSRSDKLSPREIRHVDYISQFTSDIRHIDGLYPHPDDSLSSGGQRDGRAVSPSAEGLPTRRRRSGELDRPPPLVLLGIRSSLKSDLDCSAAEHVFGATVRLPGQMISPTPRVAVEDPTNLLHRLRQFLRTLSPVPPRSSASPSHLEKDLATCSHVYLRYDRVRRPLEPPYDGPFRVISRGTKNFRIQRGTREEVVSVDRLKAAVPDTPPDEPCSPLHPAPPPRPSIPPSRILPLPPCPPPTTPTTPSSTNNTVTASHTHSTPVPPVYITRSGRHVHFPDRLITHVF